jgi:hypothetical protein
MALRSVDLNSLENGGSHVQRLAVKPFDKLRAFDSSEGP